MLKDWVPDIDASAIRRLKDAGAILLGKLNMTEFALGSAGQYTFGIPRNPWDLNHDTGDSSSGSGAAPAAGLATIALGEDSAGSIILPAAYCRIVGFRPTWGLVSRYGLLPFAWQTDTVGPLARTVEDVVYALTALAGYDPLDSTTKNLRPFDYVASLKQDLKSVRAAVVKELLETPGLDSEVANAIYKSIRVLENLGVSIREVSIPQTDQAGAIFTALAEPQAAAVHLAQMRKASSAYSPSARIRLATGLLIPGFVAHWADQVGRNIIKQQVPGALEEFDILIAPAARTAAPLIPTSEGLPSFIDQDRNEFRAAISSNVLPFALAGAPVSSVFCGFNNSGMPLSMQIAGRPLEDALVLRIASAYQEATDWHHRRPPLVGLTRPHQEVHLE